MQRKTAFFPMTLDPWAKHREVRCFRKTVAIGGGDLLQEDDVHQDDSIDNSCKVGHACAQVQSKPQMNLSSHKIKP